MGVSVETERYLFRAEQLRQTHARVRSHSLEPPLGPLPGLDLAGIAWVIAGGESGPGARPMDASWARDGRGRCLAAREKPRGSCESCGSSLRRTSVLIEQGLSCASFDLIPGGFPQGRKLLTVSRIGGIPRRVLALHLFLTIIQPGIWIFGDGRRPCRLRLQETREVIDLRRTLYGHGLHDGRCGARIVLRATGFFRPVQLVSCIADPNSSADGAGRVNVRVSPKIAQLQVRRDPSYHTLACLPTTRLPRRRHGTRRKSPAGVLARLSTPQPPGGQRADFRSLLSHSLSTAAPSAWRAGCRRWVSLTTQLTSDWRSYWIARHEESGAIGSRRPGTSAHSPTLSGVARSLPGGFALLALTTPSSWLSIRSNPRC